MGRSIVAFLAVVWGIPVGAGELEGAQGSQTLLRVGKDLRGEASFTTTVRTDIFKIASRLETVSENVYQCEGDLRTDRVATGDIALWLAGNVKGLNLTTARKLVQDGHFDGLPRNWTEFQRRVRQGDEAYRTGFSYDVLVTHKEANLVHLGYFIAGQCGLTVRRTEYRVPVRTFHHKESRAFRVEVTGAPLLAREKETFTVSFDGQEDGVTVDSPYYDYTVERGEEEGRVVYRLTGRRKAVRPANTLAVSAGVIAGRLALEVADESFDPEVTPELRRVIVGRVTQARSWQGTRVVGSFELTLGKDSASTRFPDTGVPLQPGGSYLIHYELRILGSRFFGEQPSPTKGARLELK